MQTYARQGGSSSILIHDDGLQIIDEEERQKRIEFYSDHGIGWVARPPHSSAPDGFKRAGRFKKASNMNFGLQVSIPRLSFSYNIQFFAVSYLAQLSLLMEKHILALEASEKSDDQHMEALEEKALEMAIEEMYESTGKRWKPWASNARALRVGDIILLVDSDTVVPEVCQRYFRVQARGLTTFPIRTALGMLHAKWQSVQTLELYNTNQVFSFLMKSKTMVVITHTDVLQVAFHYFENGIAQFTRRINKSISLGCANGEIAPFVGHNAFLRWSALQEAAFVDTDGEPKIWSENNVSEDFDMALRLQVSHFRSKSP